MTVSPINYGSFNYGCAILYSLGFATFVFILKHHFVVEMANSLTFPVRSYYVHVIFLLVMLAALNVVSFELTVIHTNDVRARFDPVSAKRGRDCTAEQDEQGACYGGLARRVTKINEIRNSTENVLLLDAGHQFQGSIWFYVYRGLATAHFMNRLSYDAMVSYITRRNVFF